MTATTGLARIIEDPTPLVDERVGLLTHAAAVDVNLRHILDLFLDKGIDVRAVFGPQHGLSGHTQDNMVEWRSYRDERRNLPVYSLYGEHRKPTSEMLSDISCLVADLVDVGARCYTFVWTLRLAMEACAEANVKVVVLDRPNPIGGMDVEGPVLERERRSFVGMHEIPMRHGMTIGELALMFNEEDDVGCDLTVVPVEGWDRKQHFELTGLPWVMPSPNMPTPDTALYYPGICLIEGTTLSEGRGTTRPFEIVGAPGIAPYKLAQKVEKLRLPGVRFRPMRFEPTFQKHAGTLCGGVQLHVNDVLSFRPVRTAVALLLAMRDVAPDAWTWRRPPYEYEQNRLPFDIIAGSDELRRLIETDAPLGEIVDSWRKGENDFRSRRRRFLLTQESW
jgi:uncharacterized protein YbbC (DUF1343 family)